MIKLDVKEKCQNCPNFSPTVNAIDITSFGDKGKKIMQTVYCSNKDFCNNIEDYLRNQEK